MKGTVKAISMQKRSALIAVGDKEEWYNFGEKVKMEFVRKGEAEFELSEDGTIPFIKSAGSTVKSPKPGFKPSTEYRSDYYKEKIQWDKDKQRRISRSGLINSSIAFYGLQKQSEDEVKTVVTEEQILETAKKFEAFVHGEECE